MDIRLTGQRADTLLHTTVVVSYVLRQRRRIAGLGGGSRRGVFFFTELMGCIGRDVVVLYA